MIRHRRTLLLAGVTALALVLQACAKPPAAEPPPEPVAGQRVPYVIGIPDVLEIVVWKNPELSKQVVVRRDGMISVPLIGDVQAEGLTPTELTEVLSQSLSDYISTPDVTVMVVRSDSNSVAVVGAVGRSSVIPLSKEMRVLDAIAMVGGFNTWARRSDVRILRSFEDGTQTLYRFNYGAFLSGDAPDSNLLLEPGDTIIVPD